MGKYSYVGIGASIFHGVEIDENCIVGGGSVLNKNTKSNSTYYGIPARRVSGRKLGDAYLWLLKKSFITNFWIFRSNRKNLWRR